MAASACNGARRLSDLLREQQEPFLEVPQRRSPVDACGRRLRDLCALTKRRKVNVVSDDGGGTLLCGGYKPARKALPLRWGDLAGCVACGARHRFRRLPRAGDIGDRCDVASELEGGDALDGGRQLSPASVLELHSDEESPVLSHWDEDDDDKPSTSASSPPPDHDLLPGAAAPCPTFFVTSGKIRAMEAEVEGNNKRLQRSDYSALEEMERATVSGWERIAADISRIPSLVALDVAESAREWSRVAGDEEARRVGQSIEAMIFEEVRWEAVRDMICQREF
ncbi:hypothetical protein GQ55_3G483200 [Panicum hallii var. hallii]|uniref:DUF4378 domain-containing protein n=1 Tax=Panicum hallii var. hallii TaxID=1504633 RepID=A0A2T7EJN1_9POAL|nr:hypothetical protein GQ55_3G483200 [Panicum hallii var. hallii]